jgi:MFS family permease
VTPARRLVLVVWITLAVAYGLFFSFSVFFVPLIQEFRWSRGLTAGAMSVSSIVQGVFAPVAGVLADRFGPRAMIVAGVVMLAAASMLAATIQAPWQLYLYTGVLSALGLVCIGWVPMGLLISRWFQARRGRMAGVAFSGMGFGVFVLGPVTQWLIALSSWRTASLILGTATLGLLLPLVLWGIREPDATIPAPAATVASTAPRARRDTDATLRDALGSPAFWFLFAAYFCTPLAVFPVSTHAVAFAVDQGYAPMLAATAYGSMGLMSTVGRAGFGFLADRLGGPLAATLSYGCTAGGVAALLALEAVPGVGWLAVFALLFGLGFGARGPIITAIASEWFGGRRFGVIYGVLNLGNGLAGAIGPWFAGFVHDVSGSYRAAFAASIAFCACGSACFWLARRRAP